MAVKHLLLLAALLGVVTAGAAARHAVPFAVPPTSATDLTAAAPWPADVPIRLCALRVEFLPDNVSGTTGTGLMGSGLPDTLLIDPLPHDHAYFEDHLRFLRNYYRKVSGGKVEIDSAAWAILPAGDSAAFVLDHPMWHYNYNADSTLLNQRLVELFVEAVAKAAAQGVDFTQYDAVLIFHAGVGKDFNLGFDATPFDIPSAYINPADLQGYAGGIAIPPGVTRGLILPEAENQPEVLEFGIELSMNGILVKLFGNWLGLPDLFDTETGRSGVGRWAMMDQGSGNVLALVPAYPDAWSRVYLGWDSAHVVVPSRFGDSVRVARTEKGGAPHIVKFPITPREYYLVENRDADADSVGLVELRDRDGRVMRSTWDGELTVDPGFRVAIEADRYDFGIPGSGLLVWHIDEDVIAAGLPSNRVNVDPDHRGIDLVEADAAQDIGREYGFASAGSGTELGWQGDAWYRDNEDHRAANGNALTVRFADATFPPARLHDGAFTGLELTAFSLVDSVMSFVARSTTAAPGFPVALPARATWTVADLDGDGVNEIYFATDDSLYAADSSGTLTVLAALPVGVHLMAFNPPVDIDADSLDELLFGGVQLGVAEMQAGVFTTRFTGEWNVYGANPYPARTASGTPRLLVVYPLQPVTDTTFATLFDLNLNSLSVGMDLAVGQTARLPYNIESFPAQRFVFAGSGEAAAFSVGDSSLTLLWRVTDTRIQPQAVIVAEGVTTTNLEPTRRTVFLAGYGYVNADDGATVCLMPDCLPPQVDWNGDGLPEGGGPFGRNDLPTEDAPRFTADTTWIIDVDATGSPDWAGYDQPQQLDSTERVFTRVEAVSHNGTAFSGLPRAAALADSQRPFVWGRGSDLHYLTVAHGDSGQSLYTVHKLLPARGTSRYPYQEEMAILNIGALRPQANARADWLYCWPNPATDVSRIRITLDYPARAEIRVFDLAGRKVAELSGSSSTPGPLAFEVPWDVSHVESGVYIGRVIVTGNGTTRESQLKIAVVK